MIKKIIIAGVLLFTVISIWLWFVVPEITKLPKDFSYTADLISRDNFYDETRQQFSGEKRSVTKFSYEVITEKDGIFTIKNIFDVQKITGEKIFSVERLYGIDSKTGEHVGGSGDETRDGYLFAPHNLKRGESFTYWHINYDAPAHMIFAGEEDIDGLHVYRYETRYEGVMIDQTNNLTHLPQVGITRGIELEPYLQLWIEPLSGHLIKYSDDTIAYYYDLQTGVRQNPWNHFSNSYMLESITHHVQLAKEEKLTIRILYYIIPVLFTLCSIMILLLGYFRNTIMPLLVSGCLVFALLVGWKVWHSQKFLPQLTYTGPMEKVRVGILNFPGGTPILIADEKGYFREEGLDVDIRIFDSGKSALGTMLKDKALDIVTVAQTPIVVNSFDYSDFVVISGIVSSANDSKILTSHESHISTPIELRGKTIGITKGTTGQYFMSLFLAQHGLDVRDIKILDIPAADLPEALRSGKVDAISTWEPHIYNAQKSLGANSYLIESADTFRTDYYFVSFADWVQNNPEIVKKFLRAIDRANNFIAQYPNDAQDTVLLHTDFEPAFIRSVWGDYQYELFLDQSVLLTFEQQARWLISNKFIESPRMPNYLNYIYFDALESIKPKSVTIIR